MSYDWLCVENLIQGLAPPSRHGVFTVNGTAHPDPFDLTDLAANVGRSLNDELFYWQPIGYPADTFPMDPSVEAGVAELVAQIKRVKDKLGYRTIFLVGYSQGAMVVARVWRDHILNPDGDLHDRVNDVLGIWQFGDPFRCPGIANGNKQIGAPMPKQLDQVTTGGIAGPLCLTVPQTPWFYMSQAADGDMYACAPIGDNPWTAEAEVGAIETSIYNVVQQVDTDDVMAIAMIVLKTLTMPEVTLIPMIQAILNAGMFFAAGSSAPHYTYPIDGAVSWISQRGAAVPPAWV